MKYGSRFLRPATNSDIPRLPTLLHEFPELIRVCMDGSVHGQAFEQLVTGPYCILAEDNHFVIYGVDPVTRRPGKGRIEAGVFQYIVDHHQNWDGSLRQGRLYVPRDESTHLR